MPCLPAKSSHPFTHGFVLPASFFSSLLPPRGWGWQLQRSTPLCSTSLVVVLQAMSRTSVSDASRWVESHLNVGRVQRTRSNGGSSWAAMHVLETEGGKKLFLKTSRNGAEGLEMFQGEAIGLNAMHHTHTMVVPKVYHVGVAEGGLESYILMDFLEFGGRASQQEFGRKLAQMHLAEPMADEAKRGSFGFPVQNTIGGTPQPNAWNDDWVEFFRTQRLQHQLRLARDAELSKLGDKLCNKLDDYFEGIEVKPSTLHGDLWSGNIASCNGEPSVFDPACYYGHHEAEFGMSWCAGFTSGFWNGYRELISKVRGLVTFPLPAIERRLLCHVSHRLLTRFECFVRKGTRMGRAPPDLYAVPHPQPLQFVWGRVSIPMRIHPSEPRRLMTK